MSVRELGRYRLLDRLGQGGMATVYRASDPQLGRDVAIKVMHPFIAEKSEAARRFEREARAVAGLHHPNVLQLHDYHPAEGERPAYLVMELLSGPSLRSFLDEHGTPFAEVGAIIGLRVAQALEAAHARGIIHRDVKPENVMFDGNRVVLCDFGIARMAVEGHTMTATGAVIGSPTFMSPEQARGESTDARSDLFSLGSLLYTLATGVPPFAGPQPLVIMNKITKGEHRPPTAKNPRVPRWLERAIEKCLKLNPDDRHASAAALAEVLSDGLRADGLGDFDAELSAYLKDPPGYNERFPPRIIEASIAQMHQAVAEKNRPRALSAASRILSWEPQHAEALAVVDKFDLPERNWWTWAAVAGALVVGAGGGGYAYLRHPAPPPPSSLETEMIRPETKPMVESRRSEAPAPPELPASIAPDVKPVEGVKAHGKKHVSAPPPEATPPEPAAVVEPPPTAPPQKDDSPGELTVAITPWCNLTIDGTARGRAPLTLKLPPGQHHVECRQGSAAVSRDVTISPGKSEVLRERLFGAARITPRLEKGVEFAVDDGPAGANARDAPPGQHRVTLYRDGKAGETRWLSISPEGCKLVDTPELTCEKP